MQMYTRISQLILANNSQGNKVWGDTPDYLRDIPMFHADILLGFREVFAFSEEWLFLSLLTYKTICTTAGWGPGVQAVGAGWV